jgi:hypothetical protein
MLQNTGTATVDIPADVAITQQYRFKITDDSNSSNVNLSPAFTIAPLPSNYTPASSSSAAATSTSNSAPSSTTASKKPHNGLSTGAIAGIAIGAALIILAIVAALTYFYFRRQKHKDWMEQQQQRASTQQRPVDQAPPYDGNYRYDPMHAQAPNMEVVTPMKSNDAGRGWREPSEVSGDRRFPREMDGTTRFQQREVAELPGDSAERR